MNKLLLLTTAKKELERLGIKIVNNEQCIVDTDFSRTICSVNDDMLFTKVVSDAVCKVTDDLLISVDPWYNERVADTEEDALQDIRDYVKSRKSYSMVLDDCRTLLYETNKEIEKAKSILSDNDLIDYIDSKYNELDKTVGQLFKLDNELA